MKELDEYTAEVRRRVDEKRRAKKRRLGSITAFSVPLVMLAVLAAVLLPHFKPKPDGAAPDTDSLTEAIGSQSIVTVYVEPITSSDHIVDEFSNEAAPELAPPSVEGSEKDELIELIESIESGPLDEAAPGSDSATPTLAWSIELTDAGGNTRSYVLGYLSLTNTATGVKHQLTEEQYSKMLILIRGY